MFLSKVKFSSWVNKYFIVTIEILYIDFIVTNDIL